MSLADIKAKIDADAKEERNKILEAAENQVGAISGEADRTVEGIRQEFSERLEQERPEVMRRRAIVAELDVRKEDLAARRKIINETFSSALSILSSAPADRYGPIMEKLLLEAIESKDEKVRVGSREKVITETWIRDFNGKHGTGVSLSDEKAPIIGGFILRKGRVDTNCSWEMLLESLRTDLEAEIVDRLFSG